MPFPYKRALLVGATAGIGAALADKLIAEGVKVIAVGRREERLQALVKKHGSNQASAIKFDVTDKAGLKSFVNSVLETYPDLDCVWLNSGIQGQHRLSRPAEVDLNAFHNEMHVNFTCLVNLAMAFLPHLQAKSQPTSLVFTGSGLGFAPAATIPAYSASKAALNSFICSLRVQSQAKATKIIEVWPPVVQSELHDYMGKETGRSFGMPVDEFVDAAWAELVTGAEEIIIGSLGTTPRDEFMEAVARKNKISDNLCNILVSRFEL